MIDAAIARLEDARPPFRLIDGLGAFAQLKGPPVALPAAYVLPLAEQAGDNQRVNELHQRVSAQIGVVIVAQGVADNHGRQAVADLAALRLAVRDRILGWPPASEFEPFIFAGGELLAAEGGTVWWQDSFATAFHLFQ